MMDQATIQLYVGWIFISLMITILSLLLKYCFHGIALILSVNTKRIFRDIYNVHCKPWHFTNVWNWKLLKVGSFVQVMHSSILGRSSIYYGNYTEISGFTVSSILCFQGALPEAYSRCWLCRNVLLLGVHKCIYIYIH